MLLILRRRLRLPELGGSAFDVDGILDFEYWIEDKRIFVWASQGWHGEMCKRASERVLGEIGYQILLGIVQVKGMILAYR
jgi:hypothetical protein